MASNSIGYFKHLITRQIHNAKQAYMSRTKGQEVNNIDRYSKT